MSPVVSDISHTYPRMSDPLYHHANAHIFRHDVWASLLFRRRIKPPTAFYPSFLQHPRALLANSKTSSNRCMLCFLLWGLHTNSKAIRKAFMLFFLLCFQKVEQTRLCASREAWYWLQSLKLEEALEKCRNSHDSDMFQPLFFSEVRKSKCVCRHVRFPRAQETRSLNQDPRSTKSWLSQPREKVMISRMIGGLPRR
jgi:hypothetical protein